MSKKQKTNEITTANTHSPFPKFTFGPRGDFWAEYPALRRLLIAGSLVISTPCPLLIFLALRASAGISGRTSGACSTTYRVLKTSKSCLTSGTVSSMHSRRKHPQLTKNKTLSMCGKYFLSFCPGDSSYQISKSSSTNCSDRPRVGACSASSRDILNSVWDLLRAKSLNR